MTHTKLMKKIEERAETVAQSDKLLCTVSLYIEGAKAMLEELTTSMGAEFDLDAATQYVKHAPTREVFVNAFTAKENAMVEAARWQHSQLSAILAAKDLEIERLKEYEWKYKELCK